MYCLLHFLHSIIYVKLVELQVIWCFICLVSPVLVKVYDVLPFSMNGQVRHPCFEPQRNVPAESLGVLLVLASLARTSRPRRLGERRKATTGTSLKMGLYTSGMSHPDPSAPPSPAPTKKTCGYPL